MVNRCERTKRTLGLLKISAPISFILVCLWPCPVVAHQVNAFHFYPVYVSSCRITMKESDRKTMRKTSISVWLGAHRASLTALTEGSNIGSLVFPAVSIAHRSTLDLC